MDLFSWWIEWALVGTRRGARSRGQVPILPSFPNQHATSPEDLDHRFPARLRPSHPRMHRWLWLWACPLAASLRQSGRRLPRPTSGVPVPIRRFAGDFTSTKASVEQEEEEEGDPLGRRGFGHRLCGSFLALLGTASFPLEAVQARGLVSFPCTQPLLNVYHLMRAGTNLLEEEDIWSTNPLFLTNREAALSETGIQEAQAAADILQEAGINPSVIKYSLAASAMDTAGILRDDLKVGQNRLIPEFTFMDPRAIGKWDTMSLQATLPAVVAMDDLEAGSDGRGARPPPNIDGTPQDTLADQAIRLRQLMSILETQFSGDNIVLVFPDGSSPALLSAMMAGIPYNKAHVLEYAPGEIRLDVTRTSTLALYETKRRENASEYSALLQRGEKELKRLRSLDEESLVSKKDKMMENEQIAIEEEYRRKEEARIAKQEADRQARAERQKQIQAARAAQEEAHREEAQRRQQQKAQEAQSRLRVNDRRAIDPSSNAGFPPLLSVGALATIALVGLSSGEDTAETETASANANPAVDDSSSDSIAEESEKEKLDPSRESPAATILDTEPPQIPNSVATKETDETVDSQSPASPKVISEVSFTDAIRESTAGVASQSSSLYEIQPPKSDEDKKVDAQRVMQEYLDQDDGGDAWLQVMSEIINEENKDSSLSEEPTLNTTRINDSSGKS